MLNIISKSVVSNRVRGPKKVVNNLILGLFKIKAPFVINRSLNATNMVWIHDDEDALLESMHLPKSIEIIAGPNIYLEPRDIPKEIDQTKFIYLQPCKWAADRWVTLGYKGRIDVWPAGVDTDSYKQTTKTRKNVMVYFKARKEEQLNFAIDTIKNSKLDYTVFKYGSYKETNYRKSLETTTFIIWIGSTETQGLALEEALATGIPMIVWDIKTVGEATSANKYTDVHKGIQGTSAPYFDNTCGKIIYEGSELFNAIRQMQLNWNTYTPRYYIEKELSLESSATKLLSLFKNKNDNNILNNSKWKNDRLKFRLSTFVKDTIKNIIKR